MKTVARVLDWKLRRFEASTMSRRGVLEAAEGILSRIETDRCLREIVQDIQFLRLKKTLRYLYDRSPFYREQFGIAGCRPDDLHDPSDLARFPLTTAADLLRPERFLCVPEERCDALFTTSGTTGEPKSVYFTEREMNALANMGAVTLRALHPGRLLALIALPQGLWIGWAEAQRIVGRAGGLSLPVGAAMPEETLGVMRRFQPNVIISSPSYMTLLTREADRRRFRMTLDWIMLSSESLTADHAALFRSYWGSNILDTYGATEIGGGQTLSLENCPCMHINELALFTEIIHPETGHPAEKGELVFTTLSREAMPLARYRIGDLARWQDCTCRLPFRGIVLEGRSDDMILAGGVMFYGRVLQDAVGTVPGATGRLRLELDRVSLTDRLQVHVEGRDARVDNVRNAIFTAYPEMDRSTRIGSLVLEIKTDADFREQIKALKIIDRRKRSG